MLKRKQPILVTNVNHDNDINNVEITQYKKNREITNIFVVGIIVNLLSIFTEEINNTQFLLEKAPFCVTAFQIRLTLLKTPMFTIVLYMSVTSTYNSM